MALRNTKNLITNVIFEEGLRANSGGTRSKKCALIGTPLFLFSIYEQVLTLAFVIFIKPPGKEQIQTNVLREDLTLTEEEIEQMISSGRIIEHDYGHLFDEIIINQSLDQTYQVKTRFNVKLLLTYARLNLQD